MPGFDEVWDSFEIRHQDRWIEGVVPGRQTTMEYYTHIIHSVRERIANQALDDLECYLYKYAIFHHNMHIESLIWARQNLAYPAPDFSSPTSAVSNASDLGDAEIQGGTYFVGIDPASGAFAFDNEKPGFERRVEPFAISRTLVSNGVFRDFIEDRGYHNDEVWSYGGRQWKTHTGVQHPAYWQRQDDQWRLRHFDRWIELPEHAPVMHISFWEAEAVASWLGRRLPTEFEWEAAARGQDGRLTPWGGHVIDPSFVDMNGELQQRKCVNDFEAGATPQGVLQMLGTCWEWTSSQFLPFDGFRVDMYPYMSTLQFGDHKVTRGGSCATSSCLIRNTYRQAYLPDRRDVFVGLRTCAM